MLGVGWMQSVLLDGCKAFCWMDASLLFSFIFGPSITDRALCSCPLFIFFICVCVWFCMVLQSRDLGHLGAVQQLKEHAIAGLREQMNDVTRDICANVLSVLLQELQEHSTTSTAAAAAASSSIHKGNLGIPEYSKEWDTAVGRVHGAMALLLLRSYFLFRATDPSTNVSGQLFRVYCVVLRVVRDGIGSMAICVCSHLDLFIFLWCVVLRFCFLCLK